MNFRFCYSEIAYVLRMFDSLSWYKTWHNLQLTLLQGSTISTQQDCPKGGFCDGQFFYPCPAGTYGDLTSEL